MNIKGPLKKIFKVIIWCLLGGSGLALLVAAINAKNSSLCRGVDIEINNGSKVLFLSKKEVLSLLEENGLTGLRNRKTASFDLLKWESVLRKYNCIKDAQLFFDNNQILKVRIQERQPVARIFTLQGNSYLIDSNGVQIALPEKTVFQIPVFTGYPSERFGLTKDSLLNIQVRNLARFLNQDPFWFNQIQEINIKPTRDFRMTPLIGNQVIEFGDGNDYENKFHRLLVFYKEISTRFGFEKYTGINLSYANQVIATRTQAFVSRADSIQARRNILEMIRQAQKIENDTTRIREAKPLEKNLLTEQNLRGYDLPEEENSKTESLNKHLKQQ